MHHMALTLIFSIDDHFSAWIWYEPHMEWTRLIDMTGFDTFWINWINKMNWRSINLICKLNQMSRMGQSLRLNFIEMLMSLMGDWRTQTLAESWHGFESLYRVNLTKTAKFAGPTIDSIDKFHKYEYGYRYTWEANARICDSFFFSYG